MGISDKTQRHFLLGLGQGYDLENHAYEVMTCDMSSVTSRSLTVGKVKIKFIHRHQTYEHKHRADVAELMSVLI